jgi:peptide/nickel transport system ATP-binding protein
MPKGCKFAPRCKYAMDICHQQEPELADINEAGTRKCRCHLLNKTGKEA